MRFLVRKFLCGLFVCLAGIAVTACSGMLGEETRWPTVDRADRPASEPLSGINAIRFRVAQNALNNGEYDTAIRFFQSIQDETPGRLAPLIGLGDANMAKRDFDAAEEAFRMAVEAFPGRAEPYEGLGRALVSKDDFEGAIQAFNRALAREPSAALHNKLGVAHDLMGDGERAQKHYRAALLLDPNIITARNNLALSLAISENFDDAISEMERVSTLQDATEQHRQNLAFVYGMAGQHDAAARTLGKKGYSGEELARNEALFAKIRALAKAGDRHAVLSFMNGSNDAGNTPEMSSVTQTAALPVEESEENTATHVASSKPVTVKTADQPPQIDTPAVQSRMARLSPPAESTVEPVPMASAEVNRDTATGANQVWRVQLASYRSESRAFRGKKVLEKLLGDKASSLEVLAKRDRRPGSRGIDFRLRTMALNSRAVGLSLCEQIRAAGHQGCLVIRHNSRLWQSSNPVAEETAVAARQYRIQLASYRSRRGAVHGREVLARILGRQVADQFDIMVRRERHGSRAKFGYRIRSKPSMTRDEAMTICDAIHKAGHSGCLIIRHNDRLWETTTPATRERAAVRSSYRVQLASYRHREGAAKTRVRLAAIIESRADDIKISDISISMKKTDLKALNKTFYRLRTSPLESRTEAKRLCAELRAAGHTDCLILKGKSARPNAETSRNIIEIRDYPAAERSVG